MTTIIDFPKKDLMKGILNLCKIINGSKRTEHIMIVVNKDLWWRLHWNNVSQYWQVANHTENGWENSKCFSTKELISLIPNYRGILENAICFEHKTIKSVTVYKAVT